MIVNGKKSADDAFLLITQADNIVVSSYLTIQAALACFANSSNSGGQGLPPDITIAGVSGLIKNLNLSFLVSLSNLAINAVSLFSVSYATLSPSSNSMIPNSNFFRFHSYIRN